MPYLNDPVGEARTGRGALWIGTTWTWHPSRLLDVVTFNPRLRFDTAQSSHPQSDTRRWDQQWSPFLRVMLQKRVGLQWQLWLSTGRSFRLPTFADLFTEHYRVTGNSRLNPESARTREAALAARWGGPVSGHLQASWFDNRVDDLIIWRMGNFATFSPVNTDARLQGMESELYLEWDFLNVTAAATRLNSTNLGERSTVQGKQLPYRPEWTVTAGMGMAWGPITLDYHLRTVDAQYVTEANTVQLPGYGVHDLSCGSSFGLFFVNGTVRLSVLNLTDTSYQVIERSPLPGRQFQLRIQFNWPPVHSGR
jgi:outer membrane receptor protein involved in Fe transport